MDPRGYFSLFWDNALFEKIRYFSKLYSLQQDPKSSFDVKVQELKVTVGILLISGYSTVPRRRLYWSSEWGVRNEMIASAMSRNRFNEILASLHSANNAELPPGDRFGKVRPLCHSCWTTSICDSGQCHKISALMRPWFHIMAITVQTRSNSIHKR